MNSTINYFDRNSTNIILINETDRLIEMARNILRTPGISVLLFAEILLGAMAIFPNLLLICSVWRVGAFHENLRLLMAHFSLDLLIYSISYMVKSISLLPPILQDADPSKLITNMYWCKLQETPGSIPVQVVIYAGAALILERLYSTKRYKAYDMSSGSVPFIAIVLIPLCYVLPLYNIVYAVATVDSSKFIPVCESLLSATAASAQSTLAINFVALLACLLGVGVLYYWNVAKLRNMAANRAIKHTLAARFQIDQNIQINRILVPSMLMQSACYVPNYVFLFIVVLGLPITYETKTLLIHVNYAWKMAYALAHPIVAFKVNSHMRQKAKALMPKWLSKMISKKIGISSKSTNNNCHENKNGDINKCDTNVHFEILEGLWNTGVRIKCNEKS